MAVYRDEYRELIERARDAIRELLDDSTHESWVVLRTAYGGIVTTLEGDDRERGREARIAQTAATVEREDVEDWLTRRNRATAWRQLPMESKENLVLDALGDDALRVGELTERVQERIDQERYPMLHEGGVQLLLYRLLNRGQATREKRPSGKRVVWHYSRPRGLDGPIAELERTYHDDGEAVA